jgi:hypothetical protein
MRKKFLGLATKFFIIYTLTTFYIINPIKKYGNISQYIYQNVNQESIDIVQPITKKMKKIREPVDYSKLTWQEAIKYVQTPEQAQDYIDRHFSKEYDVNDIKGESFKENHFDRNGVCIDKAVSCAALLSDNNYPPLILGLYDKDDVLVPHALFLYKTKDGYGDLGINATRTGEKYKTIEDLIMFYTLRRYAKLDDYGSLIIPETNFSHYHIINLDENYPNKEWISGNLKNIGLFAPKFQPMETIKGNRNLREEIEKRISKNNQNIYN